MATSIIRKNVGWAEIFVQCLIERLGVIKQVYTFIKKTFPELNETEYKVCLLLVVPISVDDIANIIELSVDSVGKARSNIRKKLKIENKRTSFSEYILEKYYQREV